MNWTYFWCGRDKKFLPFSELHSTLACKGLNGKWYSSSITQLGLFITHIT